MKLLFTIAILGFIGLSLYHAYNHKQEWPSNTWITHLEHGVRKAWKTIFFWL